MEIDFMGLYSKNQAPERHEFLDSGIGSGESHVSLSLCTSSPMDEITKKIPKSTAENMTYIRNSAGKHDYRPSFTGKPIISHSGFRYNRNDRSTISRNTYERAHSYSASSTVLSPTAAPNLFPAQKADRKMYATGNASFDDTRKSKHGYTPTVATARKATLARFLEKRSHRLNQQMKPHLMGRSWNWSEACDATFTEPNKKIKSSMLYGVLM